MDTTLNNIFHSTQAKIEKEWLDYLTKEEGQRNCHLDTPQIEDSFPLFNQQSVPIDISEIYIKFDTEMDNNVCLKAPCEDSGICYNYAYWKDSYTLAIKVTKPLAHNFTYQITLGYPGLCTLNSVLGRPYPITTWTFQTQ